MAALVSDPAILEYDLESSADLLTWTPLVTITDAPRDGTNANYDVTNAVFFYTHAAGTAATWYRLAAIDTLAQQSAWSPSFQAAGVPIPAWWTAGQVVNQALVEVGLDDTTDPFASTDPNVKQMCWLLKSLGKKLVNARMDAPWTWLRGEHSFTTVANQGNYPLPTDYHSMIPQTWWNRTNRLPVGGPLSPQEWQYLKARLVGVVFNVLFRPMNRQITLYPNTNTPGGQNIVFEYASSYWVSLAGTPDTLTSDTPTLSTNYVWFDPLLLVLGLKLDFLKAKGFDTTSAQQDYNTALVAALSQDTQAPVLSATRGMGLRGVVDPLIGSQSVPITGYGS